MTSLTSVAFVDDDPGILQGLRRMLHGRRAEWDMHFLTSGADTLEHLEQQPLDVVVSDMRMPGMSGDRLLAEIRRRCPQAVRIVLSGQADRDMALRALQSAHQYLSKPCDADVLRETVRRAVAIRRSAMHPSVASLVSRIAALPSPESSYRALREALGAPQPDARRLANVIGQDPAMSVKVLQVVNSAFLGASAQVTSADEAVMLLGPELIGTLTKSTEVFSEVQDTEVASVVDRIWTHSNLVTRSARAMASAEGISASELGEIGTGALLHDIGKLVLTLHEDQKYVEIEDAARRQHRTTSEVESRAYGEAHGPVGAHLLRLWGLADSLAIVAAHHHQPGRAPISETERLPLAIVHVADVVARAYAERRDIGVMVASGVDTDYLAACGLSDRVTTWTESGLAALDDANSLAALPK